MSYSIIDRPIIIARIINYKGDAIGEFTCGIKMYQKQYYLLWVNSDLSFEDYELETITKPKCFIQRTGIGLIKSENGVFNIYAITGTMLYKDYFEDFRKYIQSGIVKEGKYSGTYYVKNDSELNDIIFPNLGFSKIDGRLDKKQLNQLRMFISRRLENSFYDKSFNYDTGYVSFWYDGYPDVIDRMLYYFDSNWCMWDTQFLYDTPL
jgi:hypothetical protein